MDGIAAAAPVVVVLEDMASYAGAFHLVRGKPAVLVEAVHQLDRWQEEDRVEETHRWF